MSSQSDNEKSRHSDEESHSDKESFTGDQKRTKKDRKKKRKSKDLPKSPAKVGDLKSSPGTSKTGLNETESSKKLGSNTMVENSDSNSGEKHVGVVGDNIKHLHINEEDKLKDSKLVNPTEVQANLEASPGISIVSPPEPVVESSRPQMEPPANDQDSLINVLDPLDDVMTLPTTSSEEEVRGEVPHNSLNEPGDSPQRQADLSMLPSDSRAYKRKTYAQRADDTLDDVSEIVSDITDIPSDSSVGVQLPIQSTRRPSQETSSDAKAEDLSESSGSESKILADRMKKMGYPKDEVDASDGNKCREEDNGVEKSCVDDQKNVDEVAYQSEKQSLDKQQEKDNNEEHGILSEEIVEQQGSNDQYKTEQKNENGRGKQALDEGHEQECKLTRLGEENVVNQPNLEEQIKSRDLFQAGPSRDLKMQDVIDDNCGESSEEQDAAVGMEEPDGLVQVNSDVDLSEDYPAEQSEEYNMEDPVDEQNELDEESREDEQMDNVPVDEQDGLINASEQETASSGEFGNFGQGQYLGFPIDSTTTDSGIEDSLAMFNPEYPQVPENSESNEASALGSSSAAGLQNLQNWMDRGAAAACPHASSAAEAAQSNEGIPGPSTAHEQAGPSTSFGKFVGDKTLKIARLETIEDSPMECVEHFAETPTEGSIVEMIPIVQMTCEERTEDGARIGKVELENENSNVPTEFPSNELNVNLIPETSSGANNLEQNPDVIDKENGGANNNETSSPNPKGSQGLVKDESDPSSSSREQSRESSLADMDDAIESNDSVSREGDLQPTPGANLLAKGSGSGSKLQRSKRRARKSGDNNSPFKKRKETATCGQQAGAAVDSLKRQKPDSEDESSKDDQKFKG